MTERIQYPYLIKKSGWWHFQRRVPKHLQAFDKRTFVRTATKIKVADDPKAVRAIKAAITINDGAEVAWSKMKSGQHDDAHRHLDEATARARHIGVVYQDSIADNCIEDIVKRFKMLRPTIDKPIDQLALTGGAGRPDAPAAKTLLSQLIDHYKAHIEKDLRKKDETQSRAYWQLRKDAVKFLMAVIGDKDVMAITVDDANAFRGWWIGEIIDRFLTDEGARKQCGVLSTMIKTICARDKVSDPKMFRGLGFKRSDGQRDAFDTSFVRDVILKPGALHGMPQDAFDILMTCIETGARVSEVVGLTEVNILLRNTNIPHISICEEGREVKTKNAKRQVPLVGIALEAMRRNPKGFPRYLGKPNEASREINKWLRMLQGDLGEGGEYKTLHCVRHTFKDRLREVRSEDEMKIALMGHHIGIKTAIYGRGFSLQTKADELNKIKF